MRLTRFGVAHHLGIAVIGGDEQRAASALHRTGEEAQAAVDRFD